MEGKKKFLLECFLIFIFFMFIGIVIPHTGDDWGNALSSGAIVDAVNTAVGCYKSFEGRFFSRIFDSILNHYKVLWIFINAISMTLIYYCTVKLVKPKNLTFISVLIIDLLLLIDEEAFAQVYAWITGNITYLIPTAFFMLIIYLNRDIFSKDYKEIKHNKLLYLVLPCCSFIFSMFVENVTLGIITAYILIIVYKYIQTKKVSILNILGLISSVIGFLLMILSPGTINRATGLSNFDKLNFFEKIINTFPRQMNYVFIKNSFLIFIVVIVALVIVYRNYKGIKKHLLNLFFVLVPLITILGNIYYTIYRYPPKNLVGLFLDCNNWYILIYWILFMITFLIILIKNVKFDKFKILFFFIIALVNNGGLLISPISGGRTSYLSTLMLIICILIILDSLKIKLFTKKNILIINNCLCGLIIATFTVYYFKYYSLNIKRETYIKKQLYENSDKIEVVKMPERYLWNPNPWDEIHMINFKKYYNIPEDKVVEIKNIWECDL